MLSSPTAWGSYFSLLINVYVNSTCNPPTVTSRGFWLIRSFSAASIQVAKERADDENVLWTSGFGAEGQGRDGYFIDMGFGVGEGVVDEDSTGDEYNAYHGGSCSITGPVEK